jgi:hypothetical protein
MQQLTVLESGYLLVVVIQSGRTFSTLDIPNFYKAVVSTTDYLQSSRDPQSPLYGIRVAFKRLEAAEIH